MSGTFDTSVPVLEVRDLKLHYFTSKGPVRALDGLSFDLYRGETLGLVGESGCGKTTAALALLGMPSPPGKIVSGSVRIDGKEIVGLGDRALRREVRWTKLSMVFQGAMNSLTPVYTVRELMAETYREHSPFAKAKGAPTGKPLGVDGAGLEALMAKYIRLVGLPESVLGSYPHELSGGMKQRVVIAMALFLEPEIVIMDEPTTALDVIVQAQILNLIKSLKRDLGLSYIFITHDLATEAEVADRIMVMYAGKAVELGSSEDIFGGPENDLKASEGHLIGASEARVATAGRPSTEARRGFPSNSRSELQNAPRSGALHPYTQKLLASTPRLRARVSELAFIPGSPPDLISPPSGCRFAPRCPFAKPKCSAEEPPLAELGPRHLAACWKAMEDPEYERQ